jgi:hypothetical protein
MDHGDLRIGPSETFMRNYPAIDWSKGKKTNLARMKAI